MVPSLTLEGMAAAERWMLPRHIGANRCRARTYPRNRRAHRPSKRQSVPPAAHQCG